jgi:RNA polymerase sigma-70 factor (ECF subfamily)
METPGVTQAATQAALMEDAVKRREWEEHFERLMREHGSAVVRLASAYERNTASRDDLVQEITLALWRALPGFRGECSERTLVLRVAHNRAVTHVERSRRRAAVGLHDPNEIADRRRTPEMQASAGELRTRLMDAVRAIPLGQRQVVALLLEGLTHAEIADVLGITESNVAVRAVRARKELRERLGDIQ